MKSTLNTYEFLHKILNLHLLNFTKDILLDVIQYFKLNTDGPDLKTKF